MSVRSHMSAGDLFHISILGRPFKPVAFGLALVMVILIVVNIFDTGRLGDSWAGDVVAILGGISLLALVGGWWAKSQHMAEVGLLFAGSTLVMRGLFTMFTAWPDQSEWFSYSLAVIAWGAYLLERMDPHRMEPGE